MKQLLKFINDFLKYGLEHFGLYYSTYTGYVYDREDPEHMSRLKLVIPTVTGSDVLNEWAFPVGVFAGKGYGTQVLPKRGDVVKVRFYMGKISKPQWEHGYFARDEKPTDIRGYDNYWFKTPSGHLVIMNDESGIVEIRSYKGATILMDDDINIKSETCEISLTGSGIMLDAGIDNIYINGQNQVLYAREPGATAIVDLSQIGVSKTVKVGK
jgi:hypothetical protein